MPVRAQRPLSPRSLRVLHDYVEGLDFTGLTFDDALRSFLAGLRLPREAEKIHRLVETFAELFHEHNPAVFFDGAGTAYKLAYLVIMLNADAHSPAATHRMSSENFREITRGVDDGVDLPVELLDGIYNRITAREIPVKNGAPGKSLVIG